MDGDEHGRGAIFLRYWAAYFLHSRLIPAGAISTIAAISAKHTGPVVTVALYIFSLHMDFVGPIQSPGPYIDELTFSTVTVPDSSS